MHYKKILLAVDGSEHGEHAAEHAKYLAGLTGAEIVLLTCYEVPPSFTNLYVDASPKHMKELAQRFMEGAKKTIGADIPTKELVLEGNSTQCIANTVKAENCDLVVIGSRAESDLESMLLGSTTREVLHLVELPILVCR